MVGTSTQQERTMFARTVADFCRREFGSRQARDTLTDGGQEVHSDVAAQRMAALGWLGVGLPAEYGGQDGDQVDLCLLLEAASYGMAPIGAFATSRIVANWYLRFGSAPQKQAIVSAVAQGRVQALALSEPGAGSDLASVSCRAQQTSGGYVVNGQKIWCSNAHLAETVLLLTRTADGERPQEGLTMLQVPTDTEGLTIRGIDTLAGRELNEVYFSDCFVPEDAVVGVPGEGWMQIMAGLTFERMVISAVALGLARRILDDTLTYVRQRRQFQQTIGSFQALRHRLADLATEVECCRALVYDTAEAGGANAKLLAPERAAMVKLKTTETARRAALEGMQMMGAYGLAREYEMERHLRFSLLSTIYGGTSEVQREIIGTGLGL